MVESPCEKKKLVVDGATCMTCHKIQGFERRVMVEEG